jgi:hypothetical protein
LLLELTKLGLKAKNIEPFDYKQFYSEEEPYARSFYPVKVAEYHLNRTNLRSLSLTARISGKNRCRSPASYVAGYIRKTWLAAGRPPRLSIPGARKTSQDSSGPVIVVFDFDDKTSSFLVHDPGSPPHQNWLIRATELATTFNYIGTKNSALAALKVS